MVKNAKKALKEQAGPLILVASTQRELPRSLSNVVLCLCSALLTMHMHSFFMQSSFMVSLGILMNQPSQASFQMDPANSKVSQLEGPGPRSTSHGSV